MGDWIAIETAPLGGPASAIAEPPAPDAVTWPAAPVIGAMPPPEPPRLEPAEPLRGRGA